jgi:hypothetical protein
VLLYEWSKNFLKRKEKSSLPSLGYFQQNGEEKIKNGVLIILLRNLAKLKTIDVDRLN